MDDTTTLNLEAPPNGAPWNNVGSGEGASGVYLKNGWVISARHVHGGSTSPVISFNGTTYIGGTIIVLTNPPPGNTPSDVVLFNIGSAAASSSEIGIFTSTPATSQDLTLIGYGAKRGGDLTTITFTGGSASGYFWDNTRGISKSWGINQRSGNVGGLQVTGYNAIRAFSTSFTANGSSTSVQAAEGDSGGGVFVETAGIWSLAGTMNAIGGPSGQQRNTAADGNLTYIADLASYASQINSRLNSNIPFPTVSTLSPAALAASNASQVLTVSGANFVNGAKVQMASSNNFNTFADTPANATFIDPSTLAVPVTIPTFGTKRFRVVNPDGKPSGFVSLTVYEPVTYANWLSDYPSLTGEEALPAFDWDYDGLSNLFEYALGSDPTVASDAATPTLAQESINSQEYLTLTYEKDITKTDVSYQAQFTTDLTTRQWINVPDVIVTSNGPIEHRQARILIDGTAIFLRIKVVK